MRWSVRMATSRDPLGDQTSQSPPTAQDVGDEKGQSEPVVTEDGELPKVGLMGTFLEGDDDDDVEDITGLVGNDGIVDGESDSNDDDPFIELSDDNLFAEGKEEKSNIEEEVAARVGGGGIVADESFDDESSKIQSLSGRRSFFDDEDEDEADEGQNVDSPATEDGDFDANSEPISSIRSRGYRPSSGRAALVDEPDENDDVDDVDDILNPIDDDLGFEGSIPLVDEDEDDEEIDEVDADDETLTDPETDDAGTDEFDAESEEDIQSAAEILSGRGLLGLGVEKNRRGDASSVKKFALGGDSDEDEDEGQQFEEPSVVGEALGLPTMPEDDDVNEEDADVMAEGDKKDDIDDYPDMDDDDDDLGLTSQASFGKVWELNEDTYVTITEAGESFGYELDEEDQEDQDMATMRRGKQGGWSGGLASYPASDLPEGSREWIARRSYELMMKAAPADMYRWTRRHLEPPPEIAALYPDDPPASAELGKTTLQMSTPPSAVSMIGKYDGPSDEFDDDLDNYDEDEMLGSGDTGEQALNRSIKFPCQYKFKVEGDVDEKLMREIRDTAENKLGRRVPRSAFTSEAAGRYQRVTILVEVASARQVTELYDSLRSLSGVKFSYG